MTIQSRWEIPLPRESLQKWIFGSSQDPLPDRKAFICADRPDTHFLTLEDSRLLAKRVAIGLQEAGLKHGERVLVFSGNNVYFPSVFLGVLMAGGVFTGANPGFVPRELAYQLKDSGASFMIAADASLETALEAANEAGLPKDRVYIFDAVNDPRGNKPGPGKEGRRLETRHWTELIQTDKAQASEWDWAEPSDPSETCCLNYSSGTTGVPKGVEISHYSYVANGTQVVHLAELDEDYEAKKDKARGLCFLPLYHAYGQTYFVANYVRMGLPVYIMPQFDFLKMLQHVQNYRITALTCVPPIVVALVKHPATRQFDLSSVETLGSGAAPLPPDVAQAAEKLFPQGLIVSQGWGMTEVTCTCLSWDPTMLRTSGGVGELGPNCSARIMKLDGMTEILEAGKPGELWVTGPTLMKGYWKKPEATQDTIFVDPDGTRWLKTGDIAYVEEYRPGTIFHIVDRIKELIKVKGNQVAPAELEALLLERPDVTDAAVVGVTIDGEEYPRAYILKTEGSKVTEKEIAEWVEGKVTRYKRLKGGVKFIDAIPKNPVSGIIYFNEPSMVLTSELCSPARSCARSFGKWPRKKLEIESH